MASADLPSLTADRTDWQVFGIAQTGQLDKANGRFADGMGIVRKCEARDAEVVKALAPRPWYRPWG